MTKALFKKQMMEAFSWIFFNRKNGKRRSSTGVIAFALLYLIIFGALGYVFYMMASSLCGPLCEVGLGWMYFAIIGLVAIVLGVFGSVFNTFASLYQAKDNDFLISMPIPVYKILLMRLSGVYMMGLMYELIVMIPAVIAWFLYGSPSPLGIVFSVLIPFVLAFFILVLSCILGWVVALISGKVKNKSFITVLLSLAFIAGYYYLYVKAYNMMTNILANAAGIAEGIKSFFYPFYHMGLAAEGSFLSMLIFTGLIAALCGVVFLVLSRSFIKLATTNKGAAKAKYRERASKAVSADSALLRKEFRRFTSSSNYMLNCGLGVIFMLAAAVALLIKGRVLMQFLPMLYPGAEDFIPLLAAAAICITSSMNDITAPSVSLEGKNIWMAQSLPVSPWQVLKAKVKLHLILTLPPAAVLTVCVLAVLKPAAGFLVMIPLTAAAFIVTMALFGLTMNLKAPNLNWTNEIVPIKQSLSVFVSLFGGWGIVIGLGGLYFACSSFMHPLVYLIVVCVLLVLAAVLLYLWLKKKGTKVFASL